MIGPDVTMQLAYDEAVIRPNIRSWLRRFPVRSLLSSSARQYTAVRWPTLRPESGVGTYGKKDIHERY